MSEYYNKQGELIDMMEWGRLSSDKEYTILKQETSPDGKWVSTVWFGIDHNWGEGKPLIFETMVFPFRGNYFDIDCERYSTETEALEGHERMVNKYK